jgi:hypothetical protein
MSSGPVSFRLDDVRGHRPVILVFAPSDRSPSFENQVTLFEEDEALHRANPAMVFVLDEGTSTADGSHLDASSSDELRTSFGVDADAFLVVLIGRDGSVRHRDDTPLQPAAIVDRLSDGSVRTSTSGV